MVNVGQAIVEEADRRALCMVSREAARLGRPMTPAQLELVAIGVAAGQITLVEVLGEQGLLSEEGPTV